MAKIVEAYEAELRLLLRLDVAAPERRAFEIARLAR